MLLEGRTSEASAEPTTFVTFNREALAALKARDVPRVRAADYFDKKHDASRTPEEKAAVDEELGRWAA